MDQKSTSQQLFHLAEDVYKSFYHVIFLEVCKSYQIVPDGLYVEKEPCIGNSSKKVLDTWKNQLKVTRSNLRDVLLKEYVEKYFELEAKFKSIFSKYFVQEDWLLKVRNHLERLEKKLHQKKLKKLDKFCKNDNFYFECLERFESHHEFFSFKYNFVSFCKPFVPDFDNLLYLLTLNDTGNESTLICYSCKTSGSDLNLPNEIYGKNDNEFLEKSDIHKHLNEDGNEATILNGRLKGKFVSKNVINLSKRKLSNLKFHFYLSFWNSSGMMKKNLILISLNQNLLLTPEIKMLQLKFI